MSRGVYGEYINRGYSDTSRGIADGYRSRGKGDMNRWVMENILVVDIVIRLEEIMGDLETLEM